MDFRRVVWLSMLLVSVLEPVYQLVASPPSSQHSGWAAAFVALLVFLINLVQLLIFRRFGFVSMYAFRLAYYLIWHIAWGHIRLLVLF
jgi:hypothetical protein